MKNIILIVLAMTMFSPLSFAGKLQVFIQMEVDSKQAGIDTTTKLQTFCSENFDKAVSINASYQEDLTVVSVPKQK